MPESESTRKRSRSPSDSEQHQSYKRQNKGTSPTQKQSASSAAPKKSSTKTSSASKTDGSSKLHQSMNQNSHDTDLSMADPSIKPEDADRPTTSNAPSTASTDNPTTGDQADLAANLPATPAGTAPPGPSPTAMIHMRCLIVTQDASIIIGKGGSHVNEIREKSGARVMVSESIPGNPERILNVSGPLDAVSKAFGLIVRRINDEPFDVPSVPGSRAVTIKFIIPNSRMGSVIGKQGSKIKEIQEASGARLNASEGMLPGSTERILSVTGVADAIHIATYYVGNILVQTQDYASSSTSYRQSRPPRTFTDPAVPSYAHFSNPYASSSHGHPPPMGGMGMPGVPPGGGQLQTQQIYIPNDLVGCIIGKGGSKINEIRHMSASQIKIMEPGAVGVGMGGGAGSANEGERLVVITGQPANIQMAVGLLYQRLEQEKQKQMQGGRM